MGVNHTIRLINANALDGLHELIDANIKVDCIITRFDMEYFYEDTVDEVLPNVACHLQKVLIGDGSVYIFVDSQHIRRVLNAFNNSGLKLRNILTIPKHKHKCCSRSKRYKEDVYYVLFYTQECSPARYLNPVEHSDNQCNCDYSANWSWFNGDDIELYRTIMKISTDHANTVLDPFMNEGDIGEAAILQDRHFIGIEISRARFDDTTTRLNNVGE